MIIERGKLDTKAKARRDTSAHCKYNLKASSGAGTIDKASTVYILKRTTSMRRIPQSQHLWSYEVIEPKIILYADRKLATKLDLSVQYTKQYHNFSRLE